MARNTVEDGNPVNQPNANDLMRQVWVTEAFVRVDYDGDGIAELRKVTIAGDGEGYEVLSNDDWDFPAPFASVTPIIMPHRFFGLSESDLLDDIQLLKTTITRQYLDGLYLANNPRHEVVEDNIKDPGEFLTSKPGGYVRVSQAGSIIPIQIPFVGQHALMGLEYVDNVKETRSGFNRYAQGSDENAINKTASGTMALQNAAMERILLIARVFAETGVKDLFRLILKLVSEYQDKARVIRLRNKWVPMDPRGWATEFDMTISVGLGTGNKDQQFAKALQVAGLMASAVQLQGGTDGPLVGMKQLYNLGKTVQEAAGFRQPDFFFMDPSGAPKQQPKPNPMMEKAKAELAIEQQKAQASIQTDQQKAASDIQISREKAANEAELAKFKASMDAWVQQQTLAYKAQSGAFAPRMAPLT